jgi:hypothetical protein
MVPAADATPEHGVLRLGVEHHAIKVKKGCFKLILSHQLSNLGAKLMILHEKFVLFQK